jgi:hypothetical protein
VFGLFDSEEELVYEKREFDEILQHSRVLFLASNCNFGQGKPQTVVIESDSTTGGSRSASPKSPYYLDKSDNYYYAESSSAAGSSSSSFTAAED